MSVIALFFLIRWRCRSSAGPASSTHSLLICGIPLGAVSLVSSLMLCLCLTPTSLVTLPLLPTLALTRRSPRGTHHQGWPSGIEEGGGESGSEREYSPADQQWAEWASGEAWQVAPCGEKQRQVTHEVHASIKCKGLSGEGGHGEWGAHCDNAQGRG